MDFFNSLAQVVSALGGLEILKKAAPIIGGIGVLLRVAESLWVWTNSRTEQARRQKLLAELRETSSLLEEVQKLHSESGPSTIEDIRGQLEQKRVSLAEQIAQTLKEATIASVSARDAKRPWWRQIPLLYWPTQPKARFPQVFAWAIMLFGILGSVGIVGSGDEIDSDAWIGLVAFGLLAVLTRQWAVAEEYDRGVLPQRSLLKRIALFYRPTRPAGWFAHIVFWLCGFVSIMLLLSPFYDPDPEAILYGCPVWFLFGVLVHRWARHFDLPRGVTTTTQEPVVPPSRRFIRIAVGTAVLMALTTLSWHFASARAAETASTGTVERQRSGGSAGGATQNRTAPPVAPESKVSQAGLRSDRSPETGEDRSAPGSPPSKVRGDAFRQVFARLPESETEAPRDLDGEWNIVAGGLASVLRLERGRGTLDTSALLMIMQEVRLEPTPKNVGGVLLVGRNPLVRGTTYLLPRYAPDEILIQRTSDGVFGAWTRDNVNVKSWTAFKVNKFEPAKPPTSAGEVLAPADVEGRWTFSEFGNAQQPAAMSLSGAAGQFATYSREQIREVASATRSNGDILVKCEHLTLGETPVAVPNQVPDQFLFARQSDGTFVVSRRNVTPDGTADWVRTTATRRPPVR